MLCSSHIDANFEICFPPLFKEDLALVFPCDRAGHVDLDAVSGRARDNYLFARAMVGRQYGAPQVREAAERDH